MSPEQWRNVRFWAREIGGLLLVVGLLWVIWRAMRQGGWG